MLRPTPPQFIGARTMGALTDETMVRITKLSNGFVVHYKKASVVKRPNPFYQQFDQAEALGYKDKLDTLFDKAIDKFGEGETWKNDSEESKPGTKPLPPRIIDVWIIEERALACLDKTAVMAAFDAAVAAQIEIEVLYAEGKLGQCYSA